jgi:hypothetical protein
MTASAFSCPSVHKPDRSVVGTRPLARKLNFQMLIAPPSEHLLMSPDAADHPLPATPHQATFPTELL